ncbi:MAG: GIY-YIG nuclease family protein [Candidatus Omnitrophica bacterium]|jgi:group I intron endonuclease|nr:GIY-YIG nuclease family protein [Candidatus Omnitrophota bacterium]
MKKGIIYKVVNLINDKIYIGLTSQKFSERKSSHIYKAFKKKDNHIFHNSLRKYGLDVFEWSIIWEGDKELLSEMEIFYIQKYNSYFKNGFGYNMTFGGSGNPGLTGKLSSSYNHTIYTFYHQDGRMETLTSNEMCNKYNISLSLMSGLLSGKRTYAKFWRLEKSPSVQPLNYDAQTVLYNFYHRSGISELNITRFDMSKKYNLSTNALKALVSERKIIYMNWVTNKDNFAKSNRYKLFSFIHDDGTKEINITKPDMRDKYNLNESSLYDLCKGKTKVSHGWKLLI